MKTQVENTGTIGKVIVGAFMLFSIAKISTELYDWNKKRNKKTGCGCQDKK